MEVTYFARNHHAVQLPNGITIKPVDGAFVADIAYRNALETAGIFLAEGSELPLVIHTDLATIEHNGKTAKNSYVARNIYVVPVDLPAGFTFTVIQGYSVPTGFEPGEGVTLNGSKLVTSKRGESLRLEYVSANVFNVLPV